MRPSALVRRWWIVIKLRDYPSLLKEGDMLPITTEPWREVIYSDGTVYQVASPATVFIARAEGSMKHYQEDYTFYYYNDNWQRRIDYEEGR